MGHDNENVLDTPKRVKNVPETSNDSDAIVVAERKSMRPGRPRAPPVEYSIHPRPQVSRLREVEDGKAVAHEGEEEKVGAGDMRRVSRQGFLKCYRIGTMSLCPLYRQSLRGLTGDQT